MPNMLTRFLILPILLLLYSYSLSANELTYINQINNKNIKTVQLFNSKSNLSQPVVELNSQEQLILLFDELTSESTEYYYTIKHCSSDWQESFLMPTDYMEGFEEQPLDQFTHSFNTNIQYINYQLAIPNDEVQLKLSGNYVVIVYQNNDPEDIVLVRRFSVIEPRVRVITEIKKNAFEGVSGKKQQVDFTVDYSDYSIKNPLEEVKVVLTQNGRMDNVVNFERPLYIRDKELVYNFEDKNKLEGGNEFRYFNTKNLKVVSERIARIDFVHPYSHFTLYPETIRSFTTYENYSELNGKYAIDSKLANDPILQADYVIVHFTLTMETPLTGGNIYIFGALTNWQYEENARLKYNLELKRYEGSLLLKQGYYNYMYAYRETNSSAVNTINLEGSHYETENEYEVFVYHRRPSERYDRLVGYKLASTR